MEKQAKQEGQSRIRLIVVNTSPKLIEFYKKNGYELTGKEFEIPENKIRSECRNKDPNGKPKIFALFMEKNLATNKQG